MTLAEYCKTEADAMRHRPGGKDVARWLERYAAIPNARTRFRVTPVGRFTEIPVDG